MVEMDKPLPVAGYTPQPHYKVKAVNAMKVREEEILRVLDDMKNDVEVEQRWLAVGRTHLEQAFMAINRSIMQPQRIVLSEDNEPPAE